MSSTAEVLLTATKEHTDEFKSAVRSCIAGGSDESVCYASVTTQFKKKDKSIWKTKLSDFNSILELDSFDPETVYDSIEFLDYASGSDEMLLKENSPKEEMIVELSGTIHSWKSIGQALQVTGELMKPGVYQGIDGKKCRWPQATLSKYYKTLFGTPAKLFHLKEGLYRKDLPVPQAGKTIGFITHLAEYGGRIFYKSMIFPKRAQDLVKNGKLKESMEALVALSKPDTSGISDVNAWIGLGLAYTDRPAVKGRKNPNTKPVALSRKDQMSNPDGSITPPADPPADPSTAPPAAPAAPVVPDKIELSTSELQKLISTAVEKGTAELSKSVTELKTELESTRNELKELSDVRNVTRLAEIHSMEEDIKQYVPDFDPKMLYDPEKAALAERQSKLELFIRGINAGAKVIGEKLPNAPAPVLYADVDQLEDTILDEESIVMFGKKYNEMLAAPVKPINAPQGGST